MKSGKNKKIIVAMSGGVDSSVAAALLKKAGFNVVGIFMKFWKDGKSTQNRCCSVESEKLARSVAKKIGIPFYVVNVEKEFKKEVVDYFLKEYKAGKTPNPCVVCNKEIKFGLLISKALKMGADFVATGHYVRIKDGKMFEGKDKEKDQSYFLWQLNQGQLSRILFPVGDYTKTEVRKLAKKFKLPTAETPESQEVCFVQDTTDDFLKKYLGTKSGKIIGLSKKARALSVLSTRPSTKIKNFSAQVLGGHQGLWFHTIGQRRGIKLSGGPYYVVKKDFKNNNLIVSKNKKDLLQKELTAKNVNWINSEKLPLNAEVKIRYRTNLAEAKIFKKRKNIVTVSFQKPQPAVTAGQSVVFYSPVRSLGAKGGKELLGGGVIT